MIYPLVNVYISLENHHFEWENSLFPWPIASCQITRGYMMSLENESNRWPFLGGMTSRTLATGWLGHWDVDRGGAIPGQRRKPWTICFPLISHAGWCWLEHDLYFSRNIGHFIIPTYPNWRAHICQRGGSTTNQHEHMSFLKPFYQQFPWKESSCLLLLSYWFYWYIRCIITG